MVFGEWVTGISQRRLSQLSRKRLGEVKKLTTLMNIKREIANFGKKIFIISPS